MLFEPVGLLFDADHTNPYIAYTLIYNHTIAAIAMAMIVIITVYLFYVNA